MDKKTDKKTDKNAKPSPSPTPPAKKGPPKDLAKPTHPQSAGPSASPSAAPPNAAGATPRVAAPKDPIKEIMPAGEEGPRNPPKTRPSTGSGGTSGAEDTT